MSSQAEEVQKEVKVKEVSHMWYEDEDGRVEIKDRADGIERGINKGVDWFKITEETTFEISEREKA